MAWLLGITEDGEALDVGLLGSEGFIGVPIILNRSAVPYRVIIHLPGEALKIATDVLLAEFHRGAKLRELLSRYARVLEVRWSSRSSAISFTLPANDSAAFY